MTPLRCPACHGSPCCCYRDGDQDEGAWRWPYLLVPLYAILRWVPATREGANRLGLVTRRAMVAALVRAVEVQPATGTRILEVPEIRQAAT